MAPALAFESSRTDSWPPGLVHSACEPLDPLIISPVVDSIAPKSPAVYRVWLVGTLYLIREFERVFAWIPVSQAATAMSDRVTVEEPSTQLPAEVQASITEFVDLPQGWDGYDGLPVRFSVAEHARRLLAAISGCTQLVPDVVPLSDGGLQLEWFVGAHEVEVVIAPDGKAHVYFECTSDGRIKEISLGNSLDTDEIGPLFRELHR